MAAVGPANAVDVVGGGGAFGHLKLNAGHFKDLYKVGSILGEGAFGQVRLVTCKEDSTKWAGTDTGRVPFPAHTVHSRHPPAGQTRRPLSS